MIPAFETEGCDADFNEVVSLWKSGTITAVEAMKRLDMKPSTFYRKVKKLKH